MNNQQIKEVMRYNNIYMWQVAKKLNVNETSFCKWFREELSEERKQQVMLKIQEYVFSQTTIEYLENILMPVLHRAFEETNDYKADEAIITQQELDELNSDDTVSPVSAIVNIIEVKQIEK